MTTGFSLKFHHGALSVPDLSESIEWFEKMLSFTCEQRFHIPEIPADVAMLYREGMRIELFQVEGANPLPKERLKPQTDNRTHGHKHIAFAIQDAKLVEAELRAKGADIAMVVDAPQGKGLFVRDNAGNLIEFCQQNDLWPK